MTLSVNSRLRLLCGLTLFFLFAGCGGEDNNDQDFLAPPSWIIGTWNDVSFTENWVFLENDIINSGSDLGFNSFISILDNGGELDERRKSDVVYSLQVNFQGVSRRFFFERSSGSLAFLTITTDNVSGEEMELTKQ